MNKNKKLLKKTIIITGACGDIGMACAELFLRENARLILFSFSHPERVIKFIKKNKHSEIIHFNCDATDEIKVKQKFDLIFKKYGIKKIDVLVNNAGDLIKRCPVDDLEWDFVQKSIDVNVKSAFLFTKYSLPKMRRGSSIIFISSSTARYGKGDRSSAYGLAKGAILSWSRCLANELGKRGITVNTITPGYIKGNFHKKYTMPKVENEHRFKNPLGRLGKPKDVAAVVLFFASLHNSYVSGTTLDVCGADYMS
jgi:3-oxoacyl-[acyl-carrier protein] reductase